MMSRKKIMYMTILVLVIVGIVAIGMLIGRKINLEGFATSTYTDSRQSPSVQITYDSVANTATYTDPILNLQVIYNFTTLTKTKTNADGTTSTATSTYTPPKKLIRMKKLFIKCFISKII